MADPDAPPLKKARWDDVSDATAQASSTSRSSRWGAASQTPRQADGGLATPRVNARWGSTPTPSTAHQLDGSTPGQATPTGGMMMGQTPSFGVGMFGATPDVSLALDAGLGGLGGATPLQSNFASFNAKVQTRIEAKARELRTQWQKKNKRIADDELDALLPSEFTVVAVPEDYAPVVIADPNFFELASKSLDVMLDTAADSATSSTAGATSSAPATKMYDIPDNLGEGMPTLKPSDAPAFELLLQWHARPASEIPDNVASLLIIQRNLLKVKNGDVAQRRAATRLLQDKARSIGAVEMFTNILHVWRLASMDVMEKHYFVELMKSLILKFQVQMKPVAQQLIQTLSALLSGDTAAVREDGRTVLTSLMRAVGVETVFAAIKDDFVHAEDLVRRQTAKIVALVASALGIDDVMKILRGTAKSPLEMARKTAARSIAETATELGLATLKILPELVSLFDRLLVDTVRVKVDAAQALAQVAEAVSPYGIEHISPLVRHVCDECRRSIGKCTAAFLRAFGAIVPLMAPDDAKRYTSDILPTLVNHFNTPEQDLQRTMLQVVRQCVTSDGVGPDFVKQVLLHPFFNGFWTVRRIAADRKAYQALVETTVAIGKKVGSQDVLSFLVRDLKDENDFFQRMVIEAVHRVVEVAGTTGLAEDLIRLVVDGLSSALLSDTTGQGLVAQRGFSAFVCALEPVQLRRHLKLIFDTIRRRLQHSTAAIRQQAAEVAAAIAASVANADGALFLLELGRTMFELLEDDQAISVAANLKATRAVLEQVTVSRYLPSAKELLKKATYLIRNRDPHVQLQCILLIKTLAETAFEEVEMIHFQELATNGLFPLLASDRRDTRRACAETFGIIANKIRPFQIVLMLVDHFNQENRKIRICTAVALGVIAQSCGAFAVIPFLLNEYRACEKQRVAPIVKHSVLKALRYVFEYIGSSEGNKSGAGGSGKALIAKDYVHAVIPLLEHALTESSIQLRRMAVEAVHALILSYADEDGFFDVTIHLLNFVHPNVVESLSRNQATLAEERLKMVTAVVSVYESARLVVGSEVMMQYLLPGLFHPAKKIRDVYRRAYNLIYHANPEEMLAAYPRLEDTETVRFQRHELELFA